MILKKLKRKKVKIKKKILMIRRKKFKVETDSRDIKSKR
jgi:hypothetical protein